MNNEEKTVYLNNGSVNKQKNGENTVYIGQDNSVRGENTVYIGKESKAVQTETGRSHVERNESDTNVLYYLPVNTMLQKRYRINSVLGQGGFGITYSGWDVTLNIPVAIKEYYPSGIVTRNATFGKTTQVVPISSAKYGIQFRDGIDRVLDEARRMAKFRNTPGIVGICDFFEANSTAYIVMEYIDGCTIDEYCKNNRMDNITLFNMLVPVMDALQVLHNEGIIHRDISPDNIMVDKHGNFKLLDFGAARGYSEESLTTMSVILKKNYAPEEQFRTKGNQGPWTDVYALGAAIYELITGQTPPPSIDRLVEDEIIDIRELAPSLTKGQAAAIMIALAVRQKDRWQSVDEFKNALLHSAGVVSPKPSEASHSNDSKKIKTDRLNSKGQDVKNKLSVKGRTIPKKYFGIGIALAAVILLISIFVKNIVDKGPGYLGVILSDIPADITQQYDIAEGVYITGVYSGTPAAKSNFVAGDIISALDSTDITSYDDFSNLMDDYDEGDKVKITFFHLDNGEYKEDTKTVKLANKNEQDPFSVLISSVDVASDNIAESNYEDLDIKFMGAEKSSLFDNQLEVYLAINNPNSDTEKIRINSLSINGVKVDDGQAVDGINGDSETIVKISVDYTSILANQIGDEMHEMIVQYRFFDEHNVTRECIDSGFVFHLGDSNVIRNDDAQNRDEESDEETEISNADDINEADASVEGKEAAFNFVVPNYLDVKYVSCENRSGYITFFYNITNNSKESKYVNFQSYEYVKGIDIGNTTKGKKTLDPGETSSIGCTFDWDIISAVGFEEINNVVFKIVVKENSDTKEYLDEFNQCVRFDESQESWVACSYDEIDNSDIETTGTKNYSYDQRNFSVRYAGFLNRSGYITYYMQVSNNGDLPLYCDFDSYQTVNGISIGCTTKGNNTILPGTSSAVGCTISWDNARNAGIETISDVVFKMYEKSDKDSEEQNAFAYGITYSNDEYVADK